MKYPVNEIFDTLQGEGFWSGVPSTFIRLQFCPVGCPFCDTKHTWSKGIRVSTLPEAMRDPDSDLVVNLEPNQIASLGNMQHIVITGGEPCAHDLEPLIDALHDARKFVQIETSGTYDFPSNADWITVSPKINMPGGLEFKYNNIDAANEIKMVIGKQRDLDLINEIRQEYPTADIWLQPMSQSEKATKICIDACLKYGYRLSIQMHKYLNIA